MSRKQKKAKRSKFKKWVSSQYPFQRPLLWSIIAGESAYLCLKYIQHEKIKSAIPIILPLYHLFGLTKEYYVNKKSLKITPNKIQNFIYNNPKIVGLLTSIGTGLAYSLSIKATVDINKGLAQGYELSLLKYILAGTFIGEGTVRISKNIKRMEKDYSVYDKIKAWIYPITFYQTGFQPAMETLEKLIKISQPHLVVMQQSERYASHILSSITSGLLCSTALTGIALALSKDTFHQTALRLQKLFNFRNLEEKTIIQKKIVASTLDKECKIEELAKLGDLYERNQEIDKAYETYQKAFSLLAEEGDASQISSFEMIKKVLKPKPKRRGLKPIAKTICKFIHSERDIRSDWFTPTNISSAEKLLYLRILEQIEDQDLHARYKEQLAGSFIAEDGLELIPLMSKHGVYKIKDKLFSKEIALKRKPLVAAQDEFNNSQQLEEIVKDIKGIQIAAPLAIHIQRGEAYYSMKFLPGISLAEKITTQEITKKELLKLAKGSGYCTARFKVKKLKSRSTQEYLETKLDEETTPKEKIIANISPCVEALSQIPLIPELDDQPNNIHIDEEGTIGFLDRESVKLVPFVYVPESTLEYYPSYTNPLTKKEYLKTFTEEFTKGKKITLDERVVDLAYQAATIVRAIERSHIFKGDREWMRQDQLSNAIKSLYNIKNNHKEHYQEYESKYQGLLQNIKELILSP